MWKPAVPATVSSCWWRWRGSGSSTARRSSSLARWSTSAGSAGGCNAPSRRTDTGSTGRPADRRGAKVRYEYRNTLQETKQQLLQKYYNQMVQRDLFSNLVIIFDSVVSCWATWLPELLYVMVRSSRFKPYIIVYLLHFDSFEFELN